MTDWREHLTEDEVKRLAEIEQRKRDLIRERAILHNRAKQRRHRAVRHCNDCDYSTTDPDVIICPHDRGMVG